MFEIIRQLTTKDAVGVIPTDTVYGLVASAKSQKAVGRLYSLKGDNRNAGTIIAADIDQLVDLGLKKSYLKAVKSYWPGPISIVIPCDDKLSYLHRGTYGLAVRIPRDRKLTDMLKKTGPLVTTLAQSDDKPPATNIKTAKDYFNNNVDFYVDGGDLSHKLPSTIIKVIDDQVEVLRQGGETIS